MFCGSTFFCFFLVACSDDGKTADGSTEDSGIVAIVNKDVAGLAQKGPFVKGSAVTVYELEGRSLNPTGRIFTTKVSSDKGEYAFQKLNIASQYAVFEASGYYRNEVTGDVSSGAISLSALVDLSERDSVNINVLTHMENEYVHNLVQIGADFADAKKIADANIGAAFGMNISKDFERLNVLGSGAEDTELLAISLMLQSDLNAGKLVERLAEISKDVAKDGEWNDEAVKGEIATWVSNTNLDSVYANINAWGYSDTSIEKSKFYENSLRKTRFL